MKRRQAPAVASALFVAVLLGWLVLRSRPGVPPAGSPGSPRAVMPASSPAAGIASASPAAAATSAVSPATPTPVSSPSARTPTAAAVSTVVPVAPVLTASRPARSPPDSASVNVIKVRRMVTDYHTLMGENPVGTNAEIMATLMGKNPRQAILGPPDGLGLNAKGELVDDWGTPYFFHQLSRDVMEIHSAGPDRIFGTSDDIVTR